MITGRESGLRTFENVTEVYASPQVQRLCENSSPEPVPFVLQLQVTDLEKGPILTPNNRILIVGNGADTAPTNGNGGIIVSYGAGTARRQLVADLRSGCYQIGPSDQVTVDAFAYVELNPFQKGFSVAATVWPGRTPKPSRFQNTIGRAAAADGVVYSAQVPDGARWVDIYSDFGGVDANNPIATIEGSRTTLVSRDWTSLTAGSQPTWGPVELGFPLDRVISYGQTNAAAAAHDLYLSFFLDI